MLDIVIIGAGPYGISLAAHAQDEGLKYELLGYPMDFWKNKMPPRMFIRTGLEFTGLSDPKKRFTLENYQLEKEIKLSYPMARTELVEYAFWFIHKSGIHFKEELVHSISLENQAYTVQTESGRSLYAKNVIVAVGLTNAYYIPDHFAQLPKELVSHTSQYTDFNVFKGKDVYVLGGGQSAWEAAALLYEAGSKVELIYRGSKRVPPPPNLNARQQYYADKFFYLTTEEKQEIRRELEVATVSDFLVPLVEGKVKQRPNTEIKKAQQTKDGKLNITLSSDENMVIDHLISATGFRFSVDKLPFLKSLSPLICKEVDGTPKVDQHFESSLFGLYFAGPATAYSHGPAFRFIAGVWQTSKTIIPSIRSYME
jgi:cation diffusion facilitator CzcD-associated flavoprotein CzcO